jgi:methyl-accepting chemotaxis protein
MNNSLRQIDDINMQVRLLSFNAQVQAAKAGEAGRTFSVVANEIGNLSTKTAGVAESLAAQTSQDIKQLAEISDRLASEVSGNRLVNLARAGDALAWLECLARGLESRALVNANRIG